MSMLGHLCHSLAALMALISVGVAIYGCCCIHRFICLISKLQPR